MHFKQGNKSDPGNYRPESFTSITCKLLEHIIYSRIVNHLDKYNALCPHQHGFRKNRSCESQLIGLIDDLSKGLDNNDKIVWISSYWQGCASQDVINQKKLYDKFKDKVELIIISETFDIEEIKKIEQQIRYPIYFIDPSYDNSRLKNASEYMKNVLKENVTEEALKHTNIFIKNGKVIKVAYNSNLSEDLFSSMF